MRAEHWSHPAWPFLPLMLFTEETHSLKRCHVTLARKENRGRRRRRRGGMYTSLREGKKKGRGVRGGLLRLYFLGFTA